MQFGQLLTHLDTTQQMINNSLKDNNTLLTQVEDTGTHTVPVQLPLCLTGPPLILTNWSFSPNQVQQTMKENLAAVEENFAALDQRIKKLSN